MTKVATAIDADSLPRILAIEAGSFLMGQEDGRDEEKPVHRVSVEAFGLAECQVTNAQYALFCREAGHRAPKFLSDPHFHHPQQPVAGVNWFDAVAYCGWLSAKAGRRFRLPTEAEWEWAARGGVAGRFYPWGNAPVSERAGYALRWRNGPELVATSEPNAFGLYDMCENMHEWCSDWYDPEYYAVSPSHNPQGPPEGTRRSSRGGAWRHQIKIARCAARSSIPPHLEYADYGFRVACDAG